jgi:hypothetical protein
MPSSLMSRRALTLSMAALPVGLVFAEAAKSDDLE